IFFSKIDNYLSVLLLRHEIQKLFRQYFPLFLDEGLIDNIQLEKEKKWDITHRVDILTNDQTINEIGKELCSKLLLKNYTHFFDRYENCVTGSEIVNWI